MGGQQRLQEPGVDLGVEDRNPLPVGGQDVGVGLEQPGDQAVEAESRMSSLIWLIEDGTPSRVTT